MAKLLVILFIGLICEAIGVVFLSRGLKEIGDWLFAPGDIRDPGTLSVRLRQHADLVSKRVWQTLSAEQQTSIAQPSSVNPELLARGLNMVVTDGPLFDPERFAGVPLSAETRKLASKKPEGNQLVRLNRLLLQDAYPGALAEPESRPTTVSGVLRLVGRGMTNGHILLGVFFEALFFIGLLMLMSKADVSFVWPLTSLSFVVTTIAAKLYLHEDVSMVRWAGVCLIMMGAALITWTEKRDSTGVAPTAITAPKVP